MQEENVIGYIFLNEMRKQIKYSADWRKSAQIIDTGSIKNYNVTKIWADNATGFAVYLVECRECYR